MKTTKPLPRPARRIIFGLAVLLSIVAHHDAWAQAPPPGLIYTTNAGAITITGYTGSGGAVIIPATITGLAVNSIGGYAFQYASNITTVTIPGSVTSIGYSAFASCGDLSSVAMPGSLTNLGGYAFYHCTRLANLTLPGGMPDIGEGTFAYSGLTEITIPKSVTSIGQYGFLGCISLASVTLLGDVTNLADYSFYGCSSLTGAYFASNAPAGDSTVFEGDTNATIYYLPGSTGWSSTFLRRSTVLLTPPPNDMFSNRIPITGISSGQSQTLDGGNNAFDTTQPGEPQQAPSGYASDRSLWWTWTAPENMDVTLTAVGSTCSTFLAVYTGNTITNLSLVADDAGAGDGTPGDAPAALTFAARQGTAYQIAVDGLVNISGGPPTLYGDVGDIVLNFYAYLLDFNNDFADRAALSGDSAQVLGSNVGATNEPGEPQPIVAGQTPSGSPVWYSWTAPAAGGVVLQLSGGGEPIAVVYTGDSLSSLVLAAADCSDNQALVFFTAVAGRSYQIMVDNAEFFGGQGDFELSLNLTPPPANDLFATATLITGNYYTNSGSFLGASAQAYYPQTLWWTWTAPTNTGVTSSLVSLAADAVSFPPSFGVFTGSSVTNLIPVAFTQQSSGETTLASFTATPGVTYQISFGRVEDSPENNVSPRWGDYRFRLINSALALSILNVTTSPDTNPAVDFDFTASVQIENLGLATSDPLRVYVSILSGVSVLGPDNGSATGGPAIFVGAWSPSPSELSPGGNTTVQITGSLPVAVVQPSGDVGIGYGAYAELQEQHAGTNWFTVDETLVVFGDWPSLNGFAGPGGGVIRLDPDYVGLSDFDPLNPPVLILGPPGVLTGKSAKYIGRATYASGTNDDFTNTVWQSSRFSITNGLFQAGNVTSNTTVTLSAKYDYGGFQYTATTNIIVSNLPPPTLSAPSLETNGTVELALQGLPGQKYVIEVATNLAAHANWTAVITNTAGTNGVLNYTDSSFRTNFHQRFYRALVLP
jgi:hypothetical protein